MKNDAKSCSRCNGAGSDPDPYWITEAEWDWIFLHDLIPIACRDCGGVGNEKEY